MNNFRIRWKQSLLSGITLYPLRKIIYDLRMNIEIFHIRLISRHIHICACREKKPFRYPVINIKRDDRIGHEFIFIETLVTTIFVFIVSSMECIGLRKQTYILDYGKKSLLWNLRKLHLKSPRDFQHFYNDICFWDDILQKYTKIKRLSFTYLTRMNE